MSKKQYALSVTFGLCLFGILCTPAMAKPKKIWDAARFGECINHSGLDPLDDAEIIQSSKCNYRRLEVYTWGANEEKLTFKGLVGISAARVKVSGETWQYSIVVAISYERQKVTLGDTQVSDDGSGFVRFNRASTLNRGDRLDIDLVNGSLIGPDCSYASRGMVSATTCVYKEAMLIPLNAVLAEAQENYKQDALSTREFKLSASRESIRFEIPNALIVAVADKANSQPAL